MHKVCHLTSVHPRYDGRILRKECLSLVKLGYDVSLIVADGKGDEEKEGVKIYDVGKVNGRVKRILLSAKRVYRKALALDCQIYHFHDPELLPYGLKLKRKGKQVIYDAHEDVSLDIAQKKWLPKIFRYIFSRLFRAYEKKVLPKLDAIVSVTPHIVDKLKIYNKSVYQITNYPLVDNKDFSIDKEPGDSSIFCFAGGIKPTWNHERIIEAIASIEQIKYSIAGMGSSQYLDGLKRLEGWRKTEYLGIIPAKSVQELYKKSYAGIAIAIYQPASGDRIGSLGVTKLFEFMLYELPVICTNFDLWRDIIEQNQCGICVEPDDVEQIRSAIVWLLEHPQEAREMGRNGRKAVLTQYNWNTQEVILKELYKNVSNRE